MKVPFHLRRRPDAEPPTAVLLETDRAEGLLDLASRLGGDRWPTAYRVAGGYLVKLPPGAPAPVGPIRLRKLAEDLFLPADADLIPALLDDEASGLTRDRGLVFLPGGRILEFDRWRPVEASSLLVAERSPARDWRPLPDRPDRPDRIVEILLDIPEGPAEGPPEEQPGDPAGIGTEGPPRPEAAGAAATIAGKAAVGAGRGMIGLGAMLGLKGMAELGARWIARAVERAPRLSESMLGRQEGALRELLRQFREGRVDEALRHALPLGGGQGGRGNSPSTGDRLPTVDPTYSLESLLASGDGGGGIWFGGYDVQAELAREYRRAAEEAEQRGDFRRAAYILGRLLGEYANAAHLLTRAGLHRDAALIYLKRLDDLPAAARSFEAAGEVDRALHLYRKSRLHAEAGDLLRRMGEDEAALAEYLLAAELLVAESPAGLDFLRAGDLLRDRALRPDIALDYYDLGAGRWPKPGAISCGLRMAEIYADRGDAGNLIRVVEMADRYFDEARRHSTDVESPAFYNEVAALADLPNVAPIRDDLRDRALMGLAAGLRHSAANLPGARAGKLIAGSVAASKAWSPDLVNDAAFAVTAACDARARRDRADGPKLVAPSSRGRRIAVSGGTVTAACHAPIAGQVFVGFETGEVYRVDVAEGKVSLFDRSEGMVESMAVDPEGKSVHILRCESAGARRLSCLKSFIPDHSLNRQARIVDGPGAFWLTPHLASWAFGVVGLWNGEELILLGGGDGLGLRKRQPMTYLKTAPHAGLMVPDLRPRPAEEDEGTTTTNLRLLPAILIHDGPDVCLMDLYAGEVLHRRLLDWEPDHPGESTLGSVPMSWHHAEPDRIELAGLDRDGVVHWSSLRFTEAELIRSANLASGGTARYLATTIVRAGMVAAARPDGVDWLRCGPGHFSAAGSSDVPMASALACFPCHQTDELVVVQGDGRLHCVPNPR